jgi:rhodanese-related sulfurtransferase
MSGDYAGDLTPQQAWDLVHDTDAVLVDVRTEAEWRFVGVPALERLARVAGERPVVLLCRSGQRSVAAAEALTAAGAGPAWNVLDGFEGGLDEQGHRGAAGWRAVGLPWTQA